MVFDVTTRRGRERLREVWTGARVERLSAEQMEAAKKAGYEPGEGGEWFVGRDPRRMTQDELRAMGHTPMSPMERGEVVSQYYRAICLSDLRLP